MLGALASCACAPALAFDVRRLTLEELMDLNVYSVSRRDETVRAAPAAIYVLTAEDIRRARVRSVPEALRLVPGVQVARVDANKWAVSIRGFNNRAANKLQVMIDGRSIYDPLFSGVLWESRDVMLENIDRIEVIRGPGGTLWGANAVNGVINIVTKHARDTPGGLAVVGGGTEERAFSALRYGWHSGDRHAARITAKLSNRDQSYAPTGQAADDWTMGRVGFRWDWDPGAGDEMFASGDWYNGHAGEFRQPDGTGGPSGAVDVDHTGGNILLNWSRRLTDAGRLQARAYYEHFTLDNPFVLREVRDIYHLEFQHDFVLTETNRVIWGASFRQTQDDISSVRSTLGFDPTGRRDQVTGAFVQDTIALMPQTLELTVGTKVEHNDYTGTEWQPNARLAYIPSAQHMWWGAISRAVRTPSRLEADIVFAGSRMGDGFDVERLTAYELGHRWQPNGDWSLDSALFYNVYDDLRTIEAGSRIANGMQGNTYGVELSSRWHLRPDLRLDASYTLMRMNLELEPQSSDPVEPGATEGASPHHQFTLRTEWDVKRDLEFDVTLRYVDALPAQQVPAYTTMDVGLGWRIGRGFDLVVVGQNLFDSHHPEQRSATIVNEVQRGFYTKLNWRF